jgi:hypothetical protein
LQARGQLGHARHYRGSSTTHQRDGRSAQGAAPFTVERTGPGARSRCFYGCQAASSGCCRCVVPGGSRSVVMAR